MFQAAIAATFSVIFAALPAAAQDAPQTASAPTPAGIFSLLPPDAETRHLLKTRTGEIAYTATAGTIGLYGGDGLESARVFYTAYVADAPGEDAGRERPITFAFNGGPGAASAYLHLGLAGPRIVDFEDGEGDGRADGTTPVLIDNPDSWLAHTDLVFVDPIGTGWSRARDGETAGNFYGVRQDADSLAKFIALYVQRNDRLASPKYLLGESYGGFRAAKVATALRNRQSLLVSGLIMVSPMIEGRYLGGASSDPLTAALLLPSLAAAEMARGGAFSWDRLREAEEFAMTDYLVALAGPPPSGADAETFYEKIAGLTGIAREDVEDSRGFVGAIYDTESAPDGDVVSMYDAAHAAPNAYPRSGRNFNDDPVLDGYTRAFGAMFASYARRELGYASEITYELLNGEVNRRWQWGGGRSGGGRRAASAIDDIVDLLSVIPSFKLLIAHGVTDAVTPYGVSRYLLDHLPPDLAAGRTQLKLYGGGHMFYTAAAERRRFFDDVGGFFEAPVN